MTGITLLAALSMGFMGSFHCVGMCGPLVLSMPFQHLSGMNKVLGIVLYNLGRVLSYASLGMVLGLIGSQFKLFGIQQYVSIIIGVLIIAMACMMIIGKRINQSFTILNRWHTWVIQSIAQAYKQKGIMTFFTIGLLNGLLPCGLVYVALASAAALGHVYQSAFVMLMFGLGTIPMMLVVCWSAGFISMTWRQWIRKVSPYIIMLMGVLLLLRGLNLNIKYISPQMKAETQKVSCH
jgi:sulfite exporter TauE/SafE